MKIFGEGSRNRRLESKSWAIFDRFKGNNPLTLSINLPLTAILLEAKPRLDGPIMNCRECS